MIIDEIRAFAEEWEEALLECRLRHEAWLDRAWTGEVAGTPPPRLPLDRAGAACESLIERLLEPVEDEELSGRLEEMQRRLLPWQIDPHGADAWALQREELLGQACRQLLSPSPENRQALALAFDAEQESWRALAEAGGFDNGGELRRQMLQVDRAWLDPLREQLHALLPAGSLQQGPASLAPELESPALGPARSETLCRDLLDLLGLDVARRLLGAPVESLLPLARAGRPGGLFRASGSEGAASRLDLLGRTLIDQLDEEEPAPYADALDPLPLALGRLFATRLEDPAWCRLLEVPPAPQARPLGVRRIARLLQLLEQQDLADRGGSPAWPEPGLPPEVCALGLPLELALVAEVLALFLAQALAEDEAGCALGSPRDGGRLQEWLPAAAGGGWPRLLRELAPADPRRLFGKVAKES